jgi:hypothetical protein
VWLAFNVVCECRWPTAFTRCGDSQKIFFGLGRFSAYLMVSDKYLTSCWSGFFLLVVIIPLKNIPLLHKQL